ncbi:hypothetical protein J7T55_011000 [Diaporthe amygdali]|uniref:uncharacterized protein n=1 Tax=Phomopsis amygdali TaxID=1214568 RepID=UPI0022FE0DDF|nr:uncharacterized protein J7T55_011000 [Diaporthe amygdali]KAJ0103983.1 hypothetical protein J7T55_011000 [Diaporthe amygdali]
MDQNRPARPGAAVFHTLGLLGAAQTWGRCLADGTLRHMVKALGLDGWLSSSTTSSSSSYALPGTSGGAVLRSSFTGVPGADLLLRMLVVFFWEPAYGRLPATSLTGAYFLGQVFPIMTVVCLDGVRGDAGGGKGPKGALLRAMMWLFLFQMTGIASTGGLWVLSFTNTSPTASTTSSLTHLREGSLVSRHMGLVVLVAMVLGYAVTGAAMGLHSPTVVSYDFQQWAIVAWNVYPIWVYLLVKMGSFVATLSSSSQSRAPSKAMGHRREDHLRSVRLVSGVTAVAGFALHVAVVAVAVSTVLFPAMFKERYRAEFDPVLLVTPPLSVTQTSTVGDGIRSFMLWDQVFGYTFSLAAVSAQLRAALRFSPYRVGAFRATAMCALSCVLLGPGTTCTLLSWLRDELLFSSELDDKVKKAS